MDIPGWSWDGHSYLVLLGYLDMGGAGVWTSWDNHRYLGYLDMGGAGVWASWDFRDT